MSESSLGSQAEHERSLASLAKTRGVGMTPPRSNGFDQKPGIQHFRIVFLPDEKTLRMRRRWRERMRGLRSSSPKGMEERDSLGDRNPFALS